MREAFVTVRLFLPSMAASSSELALTWLPPEISILPSAQIALSSIELASTLPPPFMMRFSLASIP